MRDSPPSATEVFAGLPEPRPDDDGLRASIRAMRAADGLLLGVLDDDPTGSQAVHGVQVVTVLEEAAYQAALAGPAATCFVLTNTRSMEEPAAAEINVLAARGLLSVAGRRGARLQLLSRSDSTLRGHVMAEVTALDSVRRETARRGYDGVLFVPAFLEAGRLTAGDIHWARVGGGLVPVGETEFAQDAAFGYSASDLRDFVAEKSGGTIRRGDVGSIGLADIRLGGPQRVRELLAGVRDGSWAVVNATEYSDLDTVAAGVLMAERAGASFLFRTGPSFVRALTGMGPRAPLRGADIWPAGRPPQGGHGLVVVGSHVGQTSRQLSALRARGGITAFELDVPAIVGGHLPRCAIRMCCCTPAAPWPRAGTEPAAWPSPARCPPPCPGPSAKRWPPGPPGSSPRAGSPRTTWHGTGWASGAPRWPASCFPASSPCCGRWMRRPRRSACRTWCSPATSATTAPWRTW